MCIKVCKIWRRCESVRSPDCISELVLYGSGVPQCGGLIVYRSMYDMAEVRLSVEA